MAAWVSVADQRAMRAAATICWRMACACRALAPAKLLMKAAASSLHLPAASIASTTKQQRWLLSKAPVLPVFFCAAATSPGCYGQRMRSPPRFIEGNQSPLGNGLSSGPKGFAVTTNHQDMVRAQFEKGKETIRLCQSICLYSSFCISVDFLVSLCFSKLRLGLDNFY